MRLFYQNQGCQPKSLCKLHVYEDSKTSTQTQAQQKKTSIQVFIQSI